MEVVSEWNLQQKNVVEEGIEDEDAKAKYVVSRGRTEGNQADGGDLETELTMNADVSQADTNIDLSKAVDTAWARTLVAQNNEKSIDDEREDFKSIASNSRPFCCLVTSCHVFTRGFQVYFHG